MRGTTLIHPSVARRALKTRLSLIDITVKPAAAYTFQWNFGTVLAKVFENGSHAPLITRQLSV